jgi:tetratricopeptide (TPR) repeat protein
VVFLICIFQILLADAVLAGVNQKKAPAIPDSVRMRQLAEQFNAFLYNNKDSAWYFAREEMKLARKMKDTTALALSWYHQGVLHSTSQPDSAKYAYQNAGRLYTLKGNQREVLDVNHGIAIIHYDQGEYDQAIKLIEDNIQKYRENLNRQASRSDSLDLALSLDLLNMIYTFQGKYQLAMKHALETLQIMEKLQDSIRLADALNHFAAIEFYLKDFNSSIRHNQQALAIYRAYGDKFFESQAANDLANCLFYLKQYDEAETYLKLSISLAEEMEAVNLLGTAKANLGKVYLQKARYPEAGELLRQSLEIFDRTDSKLKEVESLNHLGLVYQHQMKYQEAISTFARAEQLAETNGFLPGLEETVKFRSETFELMGNFRAALQDYQKLKTTGDSLLNQAKSRQIEELRTIYQTEKKEREIFNQHERITLLQQNIRIARLQRIWLGIALLLTFLLSAALFYGFRQRNRRTRAEKEKLNVELEYKKRELTSQALNLARKNELLENLKLTAVTFKASAEPGNGYQKLIHTINHDLRLEDSWKTFSRSFEEVHPGFYDRARQRYHDLTFNELRILALLKMNLSYKEIANILNVSAEGVKKARYRLRKKLDLASEDSLQQFAADL